MKRLLSVMLLLFLLNINFGGLTFADELLSVNVPNEILIPFITNGEINSKKLKAGDKIPVILGRDVYERNNVLIFRKGSEGYLYVEEVQKAKRMGKAGIVKFSEAYFPDVSGVQRRIDMSLKYGGKRRNWALVTGAVGLDTIIGAPLALFWL